jgi:hypothetical protein
MKNLLKRIGSTFEKGGAKATFRKSYAKIGKFLILLYNKIS